MSLRVGSLFSGIGGLDLGLERAGMEIAWQSEIDSFCCRVLAHHWPGVVNHGDITQIDPRDLEPVELICGGFPCTDVSVAGRRAGLAGEQSRLWFEFERIARILRPRWLVIENVPGLLSSNKGEDFQLIIETLTELGYGVAWRVLDSQYFGVPQRRRRVFIVGCLGDVRRAGEVLFEREGGPWNSPPRRAARAGVAAIPASGAGTSRTGNERTEADLLVTQALTGTFANGGADDNKAQAGFLFPTLRTNWRNNSNPTTEASMLVAHTLRAEAHDAGEDGTGRGTPLVWESRYARNGRGAPSPIAPALRAENGRTGKGDGAPLVGVRRLTPREAERLQGFPDGWTCLCDAKGDTMGCTCPDSPRYRALGNAVTVPVAEWIGRRILAVEATIDVYMENKTDALEWGRRQVEVVRLR